MSTYGLRPLWLALVGGIAVLACDGGTGGTAGRPEGGVKDVYGEGGAKDAHGEESSHPSACIEGRVQSQEAVGFLPNRPLWVAGESFHLAHLVKELGIVHHVLSRETGQELSSQSYQVYPPQIPPYYWGLDSVAASPQSDVAFAFRYTDNGVLHSGVLSVSGGASQKWTPPWETSHRAWGLGWDGESFTASLFDSGWATARFSAQGELLTDMEVFAPAAVAKYGYYDSETDSQIGTTVFLGAGAPGVVMVGRRGRDTNLTSPAASWYFEGSDQYSPSGEVAVALNGPKALLAWVDGLEGLMVREVSLDTGESTAQWRVTTESLFENVAAAWAANRWAIVGQDRKGMVLAEIRDHQIQQRTILSHLPPCQKNNTCDVGRDTWLVRRLSMVADGSSAWAGFLDMSAQQGGLFTYRIIPLRDECNYQTLASE